MKKTIVAGLVGIAGLCCFGEEVAYTTEAIGSLSVTGGDAKIIALVFSEIGSAGGDVSVSHVINTATLPTNAKIAAYQGGSFKSWTWTGSGWEAATTAKLDENGGQSNDTSGNSADVLLPVGSAIWLYNTTSTDTVKFLGQYAQGETVTQTLSSGKNLVGNPLLEAKTPNITSPTNGDQIQIPDGKVYAIYSYNVTKEQWFCSKTRAYVDSVPSIGPGIGFWYMAKGGETEIRW